MSGTAEAATDEFTLWRAGLPPWLQRNQLTLPSYTEYDCSSLAWQDCLLVVNDGAWSSAAPKATSPWTEARSSSSLGSTHRPCATPTPRRPLSQPPVARLAFPRIGRRRSRPSNQHHPCRAN